MSAALPALSIRGLTKTYKTGVTALQDIDLKIEQGDFFALLGPNGAGKSTTIGIVSSLINKTGGEVRVFGKDIDRELEAAKSYLGLMPQEINLNVFEKVQQVLIHQAGYYGIAHATARERAARYLKQLDLWDRREHQVRTLSGGMKRRLMVARALIHEPRLLILDEPTAGVDIELRRGIWAFLKKINADGTTIILTTHYLEEAEDLCRHIAIIDRGRLVENTSMRQLLNQMNTETFVLDLRTPLPHLPKLPGYTVQRLDEHTLEVEVARAHGLNPLFNALAAQGVEVVSLRNKTNRLEQLFMHRVSRGQNLA